MGITIDRIWAHYPSEKSGEITYDDIKINYSEACGIINGVVKFLNKKEIGKDSIVTVIDYNTLDHYILHNAIPMSGAIINSMNIRLTASNIKKIIEEIDPDLIFINQDLLDSLSDVIEGRESIVIDGRWSYTNFKNNSDTVNYDYLDENQPAQLLLTAGTTGHPKGVLYSHKQVIEAIWSISSLLSSYEGPAKLTNSDNAMAIVPMHNMFGWGMVYIPQLIGCDLILGGKFNPVNTVKTIEKSKVTWINAVPPIANLILSANHNGLSGIKILLGGSYISEKLKKQILDMHMEFASIYGSSDGLIAGIGRVNRSESVKPLEEIEEIIRNSVNLAPFASVRIEKLGGSDYGKIYFKAPWLPDKYYLYDRGNYKKGWFHTGDIGKITQDGRLTIMDREDDLIKSGGEWIPSATVENFILNFPGMTQCAVIGLEEPKWEEKPVAVINNGVDKYKLLDYLNSLSDEKKIEKWWVPEEVFNIDEFPMTGDGKIDKNQLKLIILNK